MKTHANLTRRWGIVLALAVALNACSAGPSDAEPGKTEPSEVADPEGEDPVSIIREDVDVGQEAIKLEVLEARISFDGGGSELSEKAIAELEAVLETRQFAVGGAIVLRGHTDSEGSDAANLRASQRRAEAVRDWLLSKGVATKRISVVALGEQNQAKPNAKPDGTPDEAGRAYNRRVDVAISVPAELAETDPDDEAPTLVEQVSSDN